ncbi:hypothetical protein ACK3TF_000057 [Chlorella vulgaris]
MCPVRTQRRRQYWQYLPNKLTFHAHISSQVLVTTSCNRSDTFLIAMAALSADQSRPLALAAAAGAGLLYTAQQLIKAITRRRDPALGREAGSSGGNGSLWQPNPNPKWQPPHKQPAPFGSDEMHTVDPAKLPTDAMYPLIISAVVPRPIGFVSTQNSEGRGNLAPYSYFNVMAHNPPTVAIGCSASRLRSHGRKDTLVNILETGEFVVNIMSEWFVEAANHCCGNFDYGEDEMELSGLTPLPHDNERSAESQCAVAGRGCMMTWKPPAHTSLDCNSTSCDHVKPRRVKESAVQMECVLRTTHEVKDSSGTVTCVIVIGEVVLMHVHEGVAGKSPSGKLIVDINKYRPISRLGGNTYGRVAGLFDLPRPDRGPTQQKLQYTSTAS